MAVLHWPKSAPPRAAFGMLTVHAFGGSLFCERVLWALDLLRRPYTVRWLIPGLHCAVLWPVTGSTLGITAPVLVDDGRMVMDSGPILDHLLGPSSEPQAEALAEELGVLVRRYQYALNLGPRREALARMLFDPLPDAERELGFAAWPALSVMLQHRDGARPDRLDEIERDIGRLADRLEDVCARRIRQRRAFDRVDLTLASVVGPTLASPRATPWAALDWGAGRDQPQSWQSRALWQRAAWAWRHHREPAVAFGQGLGHAAPCTAAGAQADTTSA